MGFFASIDGLISPAAEARVSVLDNGFTFGDSVYETLRTYGGRPFHLDRHLLRLRESARVLAIPLPLSDGELGARVDAVLARAGNEESYIRFIVTRGVGDISYRFERVVGPTVVVVVKPYEAPAAALYEQGALAIVSGVRRNHRLALDPAIKCCNLLNNILAVREAQARGALEPIMLNQEGEVAEGASCNVFLVQGGGLRTPPLEAGILPGVTRGVVLDLARGLGLRVREETVNAPELMEADEVFFTSTLKEVMPVKAVGDHVVGSGRPGPVTRQLLEAYRNYARSVGAG
jgi:branched-chain amino acid aminotransferase